VTDKKPADYAARQAIRTRLDVTMLVEAAAGTGKTTSLVARMVNLVDSERARASTIAAITFTVKAAAQLRERFQEEVEKALLLPADGNPTRSTSTVTASTMETTSSVETTPSMETTPSVGRPLRPPLGGGPGALPDSKSHPDPNKRTAEQTLLFPPHTNDTPSQSTSTMGATPSVGRPPRPPLGGGSGVPPAPPSNPTANHRLKTALEEIDRGFIGTTHAFCARLLRERPVEAGLDPEFEELDEPAAKQLTAEFWNRWYEEQNFAGNPLLAEAQGVGLDRKTLRGAFERVVEYPDVVLASHRSKRPDLRAVCDALCAFLDECEPHLPTDTNHKPDDFERMMMKLMRLRRSSDLDDAFDQFALLDEGDHITARATLKNWPDRDTAKRLYTSYADFANAQIRPAVKLWREHVHGIALDVLRPAAADFAADRRRNGMLTFQDLLICARDMLRDHPTVRRYFQRRFTHVLVDEFQDTDPLQAEVLFYLTGEDVTEKNWRKLRPRPGSLFIVGDPKQSIYRFRRADITTYLEVRKRIEETGGEILQLSTNFRSAPAICTFVNDTFRTLFTQADVDQGRQAPHVDLTHFHEPEPPVGVYSLETPDDYANPMAEAEAECLGQWILRTVSSQPSGMSSHAPSMSSRASSEGSGGPGGIRGRSESVLSSPAPSVSSRASSEGSGGSGGIRGRSESVLSSPAPGMSSRASSEGSGGPGGIRGRSESVLSSQAPSVSSRASSEGSGRGPREAIRFSDILLISWQRPRLSFYARVFERLGIPYQITGSKAFSDLAELESVMPLLRAIVDPDDEVSIVAFLRGPLNGADDDALYRFVRADGKFSPFRDVPPETDKRIEEGLRVIRDAIKDAQQHPPAAAIARLFDRLGLLPLAASRERPGTRSGNLLLALSIARESSARGESLAAIVEQFDDLLESNPDIEELDVDPSRTDAVRLMNLHQVKGLEAPVVFLIDPADEHDFDIDLFVDRSSEESRGHFVVTKQWGQGKKVLAAPPGWDGYEQTEKDFKRAEKMRLLYVAATRAKRMLIVGYRTTAKGIKGAWRELANRVHDRLPMPDLAQPPSAPPQSVGRPLRPPLGGGPGNRDLPETPPLETPPSVGRPLRPPLGGGPGALTFSQAQTEIIERFEKAKQTSYSVLPITKIAHNNHIELVRAEEGLGKGMSWGRVLHRLFEAMLRDESIDVRLYAENLLKDEERDVVELTEVMRVVEAVQSSELWQRVKSAAERYVEIPFALEVPAAELGLDGPPDTLLHGTIDLVFREKNEWFVVDYKTDATANRLEAPTAYYAPQVRLYANFWSRLVGAPTRGGLFFVDGCVEGWVM
jgi:ATP-dependent exoDNAse (exonuclease V) beta subunit